MISQLIVLVIARLIDYQNNNLLLWFVVELRLTVDDGNVPVLVVLREGDGRALSRCHDAHRPAAVPAVQVNGGAELRAVDRQRVGEAEGVTAAVAAVRLVPPLDDWSLRGDAGVMTRQNHRLEEHRKAPLVTDGDLHSLTHRHSWDQTRPDRTRPDQTRPDRTRPDQTRSDQTGERKTQNMKTWPHNICWHQ